MPNGRCRMHGGGSPGPTAAGIERIRLPGAGQQGRVLCLPHSVSTTSARMRPPVLLPARDGPRPTFACAGPDQVALELRQPPEHGEHQPRPCAVVVSAHASPSERRPALPPVIAASVFNRSRVDRASRSSRVTINTSPASWTPSNLPATGPRAAEPGRSGGRCSCCSSRLRPRLTVPGVCEPRASPRRPIRTRRKTRP